MNDQARRVAELLEQGYSRPEIAAELRVSGPRISQIISKSPELIKYQRRPGHSLARLYSYRQDLMRLQRATQEIGKSIRQEIRALDEELEANQIDRILGLRPGSWTEPY